MKIAVIMSYCEMPEFYQESKHVARKDHTCCECRQKIRIGQEYMACRMKFDGDFSNFKQHMNCWTFCREVLNDSGDPEDCIPFGNVNSEIGNFDEPIVEQWRQIVAENAKATS